MKKKDCFWWVLLCLLSGFISNAQTGDSTALTALTSEVKLDDLVKEIAQYNQVDTAFISYNADKSQKFNRFEQLQKIATNDELLALLNHDNVSVKIYVF